MAQHNFYNFDFSVLDVVLMGRSPHKKMMERDNAEDYKIARDALRVVGLEEFGERNFSTLSGGEQQRVSIARALSKKPRIILGDEPTGALDSETGVIVLSLLQKQSREGKNTVILVTHNADIAQCADKVIRMKNGKIREVITNEHSLAVEEVEW